MRFLSANFKASPLHVGSGELFFHHSNKKKLEQLPLKNANFQISTHMLSIKSIASDLNSEEYT